MESLKSNDSKEVDKLMHRRSLRLKDDERLTGIDKLALWITTKVGTMGFFFIIFFWTILWLGWNMFAPQSLRFDPYPAFVLWLFLSNMIQIFLMPLIMVGQNLQSRYAETRAEADFETNTKAEIEVEKILQHLANQNKLILEILQELKTLKQA